MNGHHEKPLSVDVENRVLTISIGIETLAFAFEQTEENNPFDGGTNDFKKLYRVTKKQEFADDVRRALCDEREDGSTILTNLLDKACWNAVEDGCMGVVEIGSEDDK